MPIGKYKIVYFDHVGEVVPPEFVTFDCVSPLLAVRAYGSAVLNTEKNMVKFKVFPDHGEPLIEEAKRATEIEVSPDAPPWDNIETPDSGWIKKVSWRASDSTIGIHPRDKGRKVMVYMSDYATFEAFRTWVDAGGSAGEFYNENIKGKSSKF